VAIFCHHNVLTLQRHPRPSAPWLGCRASYASNGSDVKLQAASTRERTSGAPLAAMHTVLTLSVCKRRDAVRLALHEPARPAGAACGGLSASAASCAAHRQFVPICLGGPALMQPTGSG